MKGFTFPLCHKDIFVETERTLRTHKLASEILRKLQIPDNPDSQSELLWWMRKAECDIHTLPDGRQYYEIHGDGFGGRGSFVDDGMTIIISLKEEAK